MRRGVLILGGLLGLPIAILLLIFGAVQTQWGRDLLIDQIERAVSGPDLRVEIGGLEGLVPFDMAVTDVTLSDAEGRFAAVDRARLAWSPTALLSGTLQIDAIEAGRVDLHRLPAGEADPDDPGGFALPDLPFALRIDRLAVEEVVLDEAVAGVPARLAVQGSARMGRPGEELDLALDIRRLDGPQGQIRADVSYLPDTGRFDVDVQVDEPEDGVLAGLLDLPGRPAVSLSLTGAGTLDDFDVTVEGRAGDLWVSGTAQSLTDLDGRSGALELTGDLGPLLPEGLAPMLAGETRIAGRVAIDPQGRITFDDARAVIAAGTLVLDGAWGDPTDLRVEFDLGSSAALAALLPEGVGWSAAQGTLSLAGDPAQPLAAGLDAVFADGRIGVPSLEAAFGPVLDVTAQGRATLDLDQIIVTDALVTTEGTEATFAGLADVMVPVADGSLRIRTTDLSRFERLIGLEIAGPGDVSAHGVYTADGAIRATLEGVVGTPVVEGVPLGDLFGPQVHLRGGLAYDYLTLVTFDDFHLMGPDVAVALDGGVGWETFDLNVRGRFAEIGTLVPGLRGTAALDAVVTGRQDAPDILGRLTSDRLLAFDRVAEAVTLDIDASNPFDLPTGRVWLDAVVDGTPAEGYAALAATPEGAILVEGLTLDIPGLRAWGTGSVDEAGDAGASTIEFDITDLRPVAALVGQEATGRAQGRVTLEQGGRLMGVEVRLDDVELAGAAGATAASLTAQVADPFGPSPRLLSSRLAATGLDAGGAVFAETQLEMSGDLDGLRLALAIRSGDGDVDLTGTAATDGQGGFVLRLDSLRAVAQGQTVDLAQPTVVRVGADGLVGIDRTALRLAGGGIAVSGTIGTTLDLAVEFAGMPLSLVETVSPGLGIAGTLSGTAAITGPVGAPQARFDLAAAGVTLPATAALGGLDVTARGSFAGQAVRLEAANVTSARGGRLTAAGTVPLDGGALDLAVEVAGMPLSLVEAFSPGLGIAGTVSGSATVSGPVGAPQARFDLSAGGVTLPAATAFDLGGLDIAARGTYAGQAVQLEAASITSARGARLTATGTVPLTGGALDLTIAGQTNLALLNPLLAAGGDRVEGAVAIDLRLTGPLSNPGGTGTVTLSGGRYENPLSGIALTDISATVRGTGSQLEVTQLTARTPGGGGIAGRGTIGLGGDLPLNLRITAENATVIDSQLITAIVDGDLSLVGPWFGTPTLSGTLAVRRADIRIPDSLPASVVSIEVRDMAITPPPPPPGRVPTIAPPPTLGTPAPAASTTALSLLLDIGVSAPARVFVTGRGIDAEMGGDLRIRGSLDFPDVDGELRLRRGSVTQLGQRFDFDEGRIVFVGGVLDPQLDLRAQTQAGEITAVIAIQGFASNPQIELSSTPPLPQDEVLARLLFGRATGDLTVTQALQLAEAAASLAGGGDGLTGGLLGDIRDSLGVDQLDLRAGDAGDATLAIGRYLSDDIYLGVEQGLGQSETRATVNFDLTPNIRAQAGVGTQSGGSVGIRMEWEY